MINTRFDDKLQTKALLGKHMEENPIFIVEVNE